MKDEKKNPFDLGGQEEYYTQRDNGPLKSTIGANALLSVSTQSIISTTNQIQNRLKNATANQGNWRTILLPAMLCFYSLLKEIKVGEPYLFKYQTEYLNLTAEQITGEIYPFTPYTYLLALIPIFLLTDLLLYRPTMLTEIIGQIVYRATLVFTGSILSQGKFFMASLQRIDWYHIRHDTQFDQKYDVFKCASLASLSASEVAFFSYIYARLEKDQYRRLTSWTRACTMAGRTTGYFFAQCFVVARLGNLRTLNIIAFILPCLVLILCISLPRVHWKVMVGRMYEAKGRVIRSSSSTSQCHLPKTYGQYLTFRIRRLRSDFTKIYKVGHIRKWSLWWAMTTCMNLQVALFSQTLWGTIQTGENTMNGFAEAGYTATSTLAILAMNAFPFDWDRWGELALVIISSVDAGMLLLYSRAQSIWIMYGCYIGYRSLYQVMITISQWNIAKKMMCESYSLVFGVNSFCALFFQSLLTFVITDKRGFGLRVRQQYIIYALIHIVIAFIFLASVLLTFTNNYRAKSDKIAHSTPNAVKMREASEPVWTIGEKANVDEADSGSDRTSSKSDEETTGNVKY